MMNRFSTFILALIVSCSLQAQNFEGEVIYSLKYSSKNPKMTDQQMGFLFGSWQSYAIKGANYKTTTNAKMITWQLYNSKDNRLYSKSPSTETIFYIDAAIQGDEVLKATVNKHAADILGYACDELVLTCKSGTQKYYFSSKLMLDADLYKAHKFGNWYDYLQHAKAVPLKTIIENAQFVMESVATEVRPKKIDDEFFKLPLGAEVAPNPN